MRYSFLFPSIPPSILSRPVLSASASPLDNTIKFELAVYPRIRCTCMRFSLFLHFNARCSSFFQDTSICPAIYYYQLCSTLLCSALLFSTLRLYTFFSSIGEQSKSTWFLERCRQDSQLTMTSSLMIEYCRLRGRCQSRAMSLRP